MYIFHASPRLNMMGIITGAIRNSLTIFFVSWISVLLVGRIFDFHQIYISFIDQIKGEQWLLEQCQNDHFFHNMAYHTDVCHQVIANSQISPVLYAIHGSVNNMKLCGFYDCHTFSLLVYKGGVPVVVCVVLLYVLTPSFLMPWLNNVYDHHQQKCFEDRCSPVLDSNQHLYKRLSHINMDHE